MTDFETVQAWAKAHGVEAVAVNMKGHSYGSRSEDGLAGQGWSVEQGWRISHPMKSLCIYYDARWSAWCVGTWVYANHTRHSTLQAALDHLEGLL